MTSLTMQLSFDSAFERSPEWSETARAWILRLSPGDTFDSDSLRAACGDPAGSGCSVGSVIHSLQNSHAVRFTGRSVMSSRAAARSRWIRVWERCEA